MEGQLGLQGLLQFDAKPPSVSGNATMRAPPGGFDDSALTEIFQETIPRSKLNTTSTAPNTLSSDTPASGTPTPFPSSKTTAGQNGASKPSSPRPARSIVGSLVGGGAALVIAGGLLYVFFFRRQRKQKLAVTENSREKSELPSRASAKGHNVPEVHGDHRRNEIDGNTFLEVDGNECVEAPAGVLGESSNVFEMPSSIDWPERP